MRLTTGPAWGPPCANAARAGGIQAVRTTGRVVSGSGKGLGCDQPNQTKSRRGGGGVTPGEKFWWRRVRCRGGEGWSRGGCGSARAGARERNGVGAGARWVHDIQRRRRVRRSSSAPPPKTRTAAVAGSGAETAKYWNGSVAVPPMRFCSVSRKNEASLIRIHSPSL